MNEQETKAQLTDAVPGDWRLACRNAHGVEWWQLDFAKGFVAEVSLFDGHASASIRSTDDICVSSAIEGMVWEMWEHRGADPETMPYDVAKNLREPVRILSEAVEEIHGGDDDE